MGRTACTEPQCLYKGALYLFLLSLRKNDEMLKNVYRPFKVGCDVVVREVKGPGHVAPKGKRHRKF
jgi:hypothetical protein